MDEGKRMVKCVSKINVQQEREKKGKKWDVISNMTLQ